MGNDINDLIAKHHRKGSKAKTPILFFHSWDSEGHLEYQGYIYLLNKDGTGMAQLFSWMFGDESDVMAFTKAFLEKCTFYTSDVEMNAAWRKAKREGRAG
jgi:hypothetical protein